MKHVGTNVKPPERPSRWQPVLLLAAVVTVPLVAVSTGACPRGRRPLVVHDPGCDAGSPDVPGLVGLMGTVIVGALIRAELVRQGAWRRQSMAGRVRHAAAHLRAWEGGERAGGHLEHAYEESAGESAAT